MLWVFCLGLHWIYKLILVKRSFLQLVLWVHEHRMFIFVISVLLVHEHKMSTCPWAQDAFLFSWILINLFLQRFEVFVVEAINCLGQVKPRNFIVFDAVINRSVPNVSFSMYLLLVYKNSTDLWVGFVPCLFAVIF